MDAKDKILFVDACVRKESRTRMLAEKIVNVLEGDVIKVSPADATAPILDEGFIITRTEASRRGDFSDDLYRPARQFAEADVVVIAAPYWDLSFPAILKAYIEQINVVGLTFEYTKEGMPHGLCRAKRLVYVTTAGGPIISEEYGYGYIKTMAQAFYGITDVTQVKAEGLDVIGADADGILKEAFEAWKSQEGIRPKFEA